MRDTEKEQAIISRLVQWAQKHESIRAMPLHSSRTNPNAQVDVFSEEMERASILDSILDRGTYPSIIF
jgi:hypothetical protein